MKKVLFAVMCAVMLFGMVAIGYAEREDWRGGIRTRIHDAKQRIEQGIENGSLTRHEAKKLHKEFDKILHKIDRMKEDGHLSRKEREKINHDLDKLDRDIVKEKHDDDTRRGDDDHGHRY
jgi:peptidoglycan hydrolase CwlO-like protein